MASSQETAACKKKRRFATDVDAQAALKKINPAKVQKKPNRVYKCPVCFGYHLTSQRPR